MVNYCQLDVNNVCVGVSKLSGDVPEMNYDTPQTYNPITKTMEIRAPVFVSRMIKVDVHSESYKGLKYLENGNWGTV